MSKTSLLLCVLGLTGLSSVATAQTVTLLPGVSARGLSRDGVAVTGWSGAAPFLWKQATGVVAVPGSLYNTRAVSDGGAVIVGLVDHPGSGFQTSGYWAAATGLWNGLDNYPGFGGCPGYGEALAVSADGTKLGGELFQNCNRRPYTWTDNGGYVVLPITGSAGHVSTLSGDGERAGGWDTHPTLGFRRAALWDATLTETFPLVSPSNPDGAGEITVMNHDGSAYGGLGQDLGAFVNRDGVFTSINVPNNNSIPTGIADDGSVVVGSWGSPFTPPKHPWVWTAGVGAQDANDFFDDHGVVFPAGVALTEMLGVSRDGLTFLAKYEHSGGPNGAAVIQLDQVWSDLGGGTAGSLGAPTLVGSGSLIGGAPLGLDLTHTPPNALTLGWVSSSSLPFSALGGTVHANPALLEFFVSASGEGNLSVGGTWPTGVPSDTGFWFQFVVEDLSVVYGMTLSNAVTATTP